MCIFNSSTLASATEVLSEAVVSQPPTTCAGKE